MRKRRKKPIKSRPAYAVVVEGKTEFWYLQMLKRNERNLNINIEPKIPQKKTLDEQFKTTKALAEDYTKVFWIVDLDVVLKETKQAKKGTETAIQKLKKYKTEIEEKFDNVILIINNPCLEFWFLLHFEKTTKYFQKCERIEKLLKSKKLLLGYEKTRNFYLKQNNDIYTKLKPFQKEAINNAKATKNFDFKNTKTGISQMDLFFEVKHLKAYFNKV